ncbi:conserved hypothetical protein [uncultured delta proteobacterium]|uniref:Uncharacterized protein n=1 Tax=uncultured delta proteobacterium TaxID=34034 RepID=A0A212JKJ0_9DELT|nr:conserved hypothetical protein [uncultured delta proteobacterium]
MRSLLNHHELAEELGLSPGTLKNIWRSLPYIAVTPEAQANPHLWGVRFVLEEVIEHCRHHTKPGVYRGRQKNADPLGSKISGIFQVSRQANQQALHAEGGCSGVSGGGKKPSSAGGESALRFNVFESL